VPSLALPLPGPTLPGATRTSCPRRPSRVPAPPAPGRRARRALAGPLASRPHPPTGSTGASCADPPAPGHIRRISRLPCMRCATGRLICPVTRPFTRREGEPAGMGRTSRDRVSHPDRVNHQGPGGHPGTGRDAPPRDGTHQRGRDGTALPRDGTPYPRTGPDAPPPGRDAAPDRQSRLARSPCPRRPRSGSIGKTPGGS
jgi:hypothetical protein